MNHPGKKVNDDKVRGYHPTVYSMRIPEYITMLFAWQTQRVSAARDKAQSKAGIVGHAVKVAAESSTLKSEIWIYFPTRIATCSKY